ncbi:MAG: GAF domain-containing protein [Reichenbachiella sp.]
MAEEFQLPTSSDRSEIYKSMIPQIESLIQGETDLIANLANIAAAINQVFNFLWVGFYIVKDDELVLGPFQGPIACTRIQKGKGVCGTAWEEGRTIIVDNVDEFPGHIACSGDSRSEIVVPVFKDGKVIFVLDIDSHRIAEFSQIDQEFLEQLLNPMR